MQIPDSAYSPKRRHKSNCPDRDKGPDYLKCRTGCTLFMDLRAIGLGRPSLKTGNLERAHKRIADKIAEIQSGGLKPKKTVPEAIKLFLASFQSGDELTVKGSTLKRYTRRLNALREFCKATEIRTIEDITLEVLDAYKDARQLSPLTWAKEIEFMRQFLEFCVEREWAPRNVARRIKVRGAKAKPVEPYTPEEIATLLATCDIVGQEAYERLRARGMILMLRYTALRISDVAMMRWDRIQDGRIVLRTQKNGKPVSLPVHPQLQAALNNLPLPLGAEPGCPYLFWNGNSKNRGTAVDNLRSALNSVFRRSGIKGARPHRFRHTLATELLVKGRTAEDVSIILGNSPAIVRKHYVGWIPAYQKRTDESFAAVFGEFLSQPTRGDVTQ
jgi:integrase